MRYLAFISLLVFIVSCDSPKPSESENGPSIEAPAFDFYGEEISTESTSSLAELQTRIVGSDSIKIAATGTVREVCQAKGCWMTLDMEDGSTMRVTFKDYGFFVPKDIAGKEVMIDGYAYNEMTSVATLRHFAEDAGKSEEEIMEITEPKQEITYIARGVAIPNGQ